MKKIIKEYFENLEKGDYQKLIKLFESNAIVFSPLYGKMLAKSFYKKLLNDTKNSKIKLVHVFIDKDKLKGAGNFIYSWTLKDNSNSSFEGVDLFEFNSKGKIKQVKIIYDTYGTRKNFNKLNIINK